MKLSFIAILLFSTASLADKAIFQAVNNWEHEEVARLISSGIGVDTKDETEKTPLIQAAMNGDIKMVALLLDNGANVNMADKIGNTALIYAAAAGKDGVVDLLLRNSALVNEKNKYNKTALDLAVVCNHSQEINGKKITIIGHEGIAKLLLKSLATYDAKIVPDLKRILGEAPQDFMVKYEGAVTKLKGLISNAIDDATNSKLPATIVALIVSLLEDADFDKKAIDSVIKPTPTPSRLATKLKQLIGK